MSTIKLPPLPDLPELQIINEGDEAPAYGWVHDHLRAWAKAYAEEAVRQTLAAQAPLAHELPQWEEISAKKERGESLTPLELFVFDNEPAGDDEAWRDQLADALASSPVAGKAVAHAVISYGRIQRLVVNEDSAHEYAEQQRLNAEAAGWDAKAHVRPLVYGDAAPQASDQET